MKLVLHHKEISRDLMYALRNGYKMAKNKTTETKRRKQNRENKTAKLQNADIKRRIYIERERTLRERGTKRVIKRKREKNFQRLYAFFLGIMSNKYSKWGKCEREREINSLVCYSP